MPDRQAGQQDRGACRPRLILSGAVRQCSQCGCITAGTSAHLNHWAWLSLATALTLSGCTSCCSASTAKQRHPGRPCQL